MAKRKTRSAAKKNTGATVGYEDSEPFEEKMQRLAAQLREQQTDAAKLEATIAANLRELGYGKRLAT